MRFVIFLSILIVCISLVFKYEYLISTEQYPNLVQAVLILLFLLLFLFSGRLKFFSMLKYSGIWIIIFLFLGTGYSYRYEFSEWFGRIKMNLLPSTIENISEQVVAVTISKDGHFYVQAEVNSVPILFLLDTGATSISLKEEDATRIGIDTNDLNYNVNVSTANGKSQCAYIRLTSIKVGSIKFHDVPALISKKGTQDISLLGMTFLNSLKSYKVEKGRIIMEGF